MAGYADAMSSGMNKSNSSNGKPPAKTGRKNEQSPKKTGHKKSKQRVATPAMKSYDGGMQ